MNIRQFSSENTVKKFYTLFHFRTKFQYRCILRDASSTMARYLKNEKIQSMLLGIWIIVFYDFSIPKLFS